MKKIKQQDIQNNQEDEDASAYPYYPSVNDIYNKKQKDGQTIIDGNTEIIVVSTTPKDRYDKQNKHVSKRNE